MDNISFTFKTPGSFYVDEVCFARLERETDLLLPLEGEDAGGHVGGSTNAFKWHASQGRVLGNGWAANAGDEAWFNVANGAEFNEAYLDVRYACGAESGRSFQVFVNDEVRTSLCVSATGGWGDNPSQFREDTVRLGRITNATFLIKFRATNTDSAVDLDRVVLRSGARWFREAEDWDSQSGSDGADSKPGASGGEVLGRSWGGGGGDHAVYANVALGAPVSNACLRVRYGQNWGDGRRLRVRLDGVNMGELAFSRTGGWLDTWSDGAIAELPLGRVAAGTHAVRLEAETSDDDVNIDWLRLADGEESIKEYDSDHDGIPDSQELLYGTSNNLADTDSDGLNDRFELSRLSGYLSNPNQADTDSDGANDFAEWIAGTDPGNVASVFRIESIMAGDTSTIFFQSVSGRLYKVQGATDLLTQAWVTLQSNLQGTNGLISVTDTNRFDCRYYRGCVFIEP
jgi:hypothetical protein